MLAKPIYLDYNATTPIDPGVREAMEEKNFAEAEREIVRVAEALDRETELLNEMTRTLEK